jgi:ABC-type multidrug transport system ATPase subunit
MIEEIEVVDRVLMLDHGLIRFDGSADDYLTQFKGLTLRSELAD